MNSSRECLRNAFENVLSAAILFSMMYSTSSQRADDDYDDLMIWRRHAHQASSVCPNRAFSFRIHYALALAARAPPALALLALPCSRGSFRQCSRCPLPSQQKPPDAPRFHHRAGLLPERMCSMPLCLRWLLCASLRGAGSLLLQLMGCGCLRCKGRALHCCQPRMGSAGLGELAPIPVAS